MDSDGKNFKKLLDTELADEMKPNNFWPMFGHDGFIYFVSDRDVIAKAGSPELMKSTNNIWKVSVEGGKPIPVTKHTSGSLFYPSMSSDGKVIVYEENFGICKLDVASGKSTVVKVDIDADERENNVEAVLLKDEADSYDLSPSTKRAVVSVHGELFSIATDKGETTNLTRSPGARDMNPQWSPDGKWIAFVSDRSGREELWLCDEHGGQLKKLTDSDTLKGQPVWSPDSKSLLYTAGQRSLYRCDVEGPKEVVIAQSQSGGFSSPRWSPDGKWISYSKAGKNLLPHVVVAPANGGKEERVTDDDSYSETSALWTPDGKRIIYLSGVDVSNVGQGTRPTVQISVVSLLPEEQNPLDRSIDSEEQAQKPGGGVGAGVPPRPTDIKIDFDRIGRRSRQLTRSGDTIMAMALSPDGRTVIFATNGTEGGRPVNSLWSLSLDGERQTRLTQSGQPADGEEGGQDPRLGGFSQVQFARDGRSLYYRQGNGIYNLALASGQGPGGGTPMGRPAPAADASTTPTTSTARRLTFACQLEVDRQAERKEVFLESWRVMKHRFYDANMHGVDWDKVRTTYEPLLEHTASQEDLHAIVLMMLGELNASHTGISATGSTSSQPQPRFPGFELTPDPSGYYKVTHVYRNGPADKDWVKLSVGDLILAIGDRELKIGDNYWKQFIGAAGARLEFTVNSKPNKDGAWKIKVTPISSQQQATLQYERWVAERRAKVEQLSGGDIGYLHIRQMNEPSLRQFERDLSMLRDKKAVVIDQRFNPGGSIDQELLQILGQKVYQSTQGRDAGKVLRPLRGFAGPMVVMANERSTSDAEMFPDGFRALKLGKVVGVTTYGAVIGTGAYRLMDGSSLRTPGMAVRTSSGQNMENFGVPPDVYVDNTPEDFLKGTDAQLLKAVQVLQEDLKQRK
jgi:tricorn protease